MAQFNLSPISMGDYPLNDARFFLAGYLLKNLIAEALRAICKNTQMRVCDQVWSTRKVDPLLIVAAAIAFVALLVGCGHQKSQDAPPKPTLDALVLAGFQQAASAQLFGISPVLVRRSKSTRGDEIFTFEPRMAEKTGNPTASLWQFQADFSGDLGGPLSIKFKGIKNFTRTKEGKNASIAALMAVQLLSRQKCLTFPMVVQVRTIPAGFQVAVDLASGQTRVVSVSTDFRVVKTVAAKK